MTSVAHVILIDFVLIEPRKESESRGKKASGSIASGETMNTDYTMKFATLLLRSRAVPLAERVQR